MRWAILCLLLAGCATAPPDVPLPVAPPPPPQEAAACPPPPVVPTVSTAAAVATRNYRRAEAAIGPVVTAPHATAAGITAIDRANRAAREAVARLVTQDGHPTPEATAEARRALDDLIAALEATKETP